MAEFDPTLYLRIPQQNVPRTIALATKLLAKVPADLPGDLRKAARRVRDDLSELKAAYALRTAQTPVRGPDRKGADHAIDTAWAALHGRLQACAYLPADRYPQAVQAQGLLTRLFANGLSFLALDYEAEWAESESKLQSIDTHKLATTIDELAGAIYLAEVRRCHTAYGKALGMTAGSATPPPAPEVSLAPLRDTLRKSIAAYVRKLMAQIDDDDAMSTERVISALSPLLEARERAGGEKGEDEEGGGEEGEGQPEG